MQTFELKSAREITAMTSHSTDAKFIYSAIEYAAEKRDMLQAKGKHFRASLWVKAIEQIEAHYERLAGEESQPEPEPAPGQTSSFSGRLSDDEKKARGMVKRKVDGVTMWVWPTEFWKPNKEGFNLTPKAQAAGRAAMGCA